MLLLPDREMLLGRMRRRELCHRGWRAAFLGTCICLLLYCFGIVETLALYEAGVGALVTAGLFRKLVETAARKPDASGVLYPAGRKRIMIRQVLLSGGTRLQRSVSAYQKNNSGKRQETGFYLELAEELDGDQGSFIREGDRTGRKVFLVRSEGYRRQEFIRVYRELCWILPKEVQPEGGTERGRWKTGEPDIGEICFYLIPIFYLIPAIVITI